MAVEKKSEGLVNITDCKIHGIYRKIPSSFGGYKIDISYQKSDKSSFDIEFETINIDQSKFNREVIELIENKKERLILTCGMTDIDIFKTDGNYQIFYSVTPGSLVIYNFSKEEFERLKSWIEIEENETKKSSV